MQPWAATQRRRQLGVARSSRALCRGPAYTIAHAASPTPCAPEAAELRHSAALRCLRPCRGLQLVRTPAPRLRVPPRPGPHHRRPLSPRCVSAASQLCAGLRAELGAPLGPRPSLVLRAVAASGARLRAAQRPLQCPGGGRPACRAVACGAAAHSAHWPRAGRPSQHAVSTGILCLVGLAPGQHVSPAHFCTACLYSVPQPPSPGSSSAQLEH